MNKIITAGCMAVATFAAVAVPTKTELERAKPIVENMTKADLASYKAGEKAAQKVAAAHIAYAQKAEGEAEKYLLLQGAFKLYARCGEYDLAADTLDVMNRNIKDLPPEVIVEIVGDELRYVSDDKAPRLVAMLKEAKGKVSATGEKAFDGAVANGTKLNYEVRGDGVVIGGVWKLAVPTNTTGAVVIPETINGRPVCEIGMGAFADCRGITAVTIPAGVKTISAHAFRGCTGLESVTIPESVTMIDTQAFDGCSKLKSFTLPQSLKDLRAHSFRGCKALTSVTIPAGVEIIEVGAFDLCSGLETATIQAGTKDIRPHAFRSCSNLTTVKIPEGVTNIGTHAFCGCSALTSVVHPSSVKSLEKAVFAHCKSLNSFAIPEGVTNIDANAFHRCERLKSVTIPSTVKSIKSQAFWCARLESLTLPAGVRFIGHGAFHGCGVLTKVTLLGERPDAPDNDAFNDCPKLKEIHVPANAKSWAGMKEWQGKKLVFENAATAMTRMALDKLFPGWSLDTEMANANNGCNYTGLHNFHRGRAKVLSVHPNFEKGHAPVILSRTVKLSDQNPCLFMDVSSWIEEADFLLSVRVNGKDALPDRLISTPDFSPWEEVVVPLSAWRGSEVKIEVFAKVANGDWFENCMLARLEIAEGKGDMRIVEGTDTVNGYTWSYRAQNGEATIIAEKDAKFSRAVSPCPIGQLAIPATLGGAKVTRIGRGAFDGCSAVTSVNIPEGVTHIGRASFHDCMGLKSVTIPSGVIAIEWDAFLGCIGLQEVTIPPTVRVIGRGAFDLCCALPSISIPQRVTYIGQSAFAYCRSLTSVTIPPMVTDIKWETFRGCTALTSVTISASVTNIDRVAFCDTGALTSFRVEEGNRFYKSENGLLLTKDGKSLVRGVNGDVKIPPSVTAIGPCAFEGCVSLWPIVIPSGVKSIGDCAFNQCRGMTAVEIPASVTEIGGVAFGNCKALKAVTIPQGVVNLGNAFVECGELESVTMLGEKPNAPNEVFKACPKLKEVHVPASAKSWAGMKEWQGKKLAFDAKAE